MSFRIETKQNSFAHYKFDKECNYIEFSKYYLKCYHRYEDGSEIFLGAIPHSEILFIENKIEEVSKDEMPDI